MCSEIIAHLMISQCCICRYLTKHNLPLWCFQLPRRQTFVVGKVPSPGRYQNKSTTTWGGSSSSRGYCLWWWWWYMNSGYTLDHPPYCTWSSARNFFSSTFPSTWTRRNLNLFLGQTLKKYNSPLLPSKLSES